jgi:hypothetical protein
MVVVSWAESVYWPCFMVFCAGVILSIFFCSGDSAPSVGGWGGGGSGRVAVKSIPLDRGDQRGSNGVKIVAQGWILAELYGVLCRGNFINFFLLRGQCAECRWLVWEWQWSGDSEVGMNGKRRLRRFEWCKKRYERVNIGSVTMCFVILIFCKKIAPGTVRRV